MQVIYFFWLFEVYVSIYVYFYFSYQHCQESEGIVSLGFANVSVEHLGSVRHVYLSRSKILIIFGTTVTILNVATDQETTYKIVGDDEADIKNNLIQGASFRLLQVRHAVNERPFRQQAEF